jgi:hypothetical protein
MEALRNKIQQLEKKEAVTQRQVEVMQRRFYRQEADRKIELHKQEAEARFDKIEAKAQARCDKLQALLEKGEAKAELDKRDAKAEMDTRDARCDKLEAKAEMDKRDAKAEMDKRDAKAEMDKRDAQARCDKLEMKAEMMKDMLLQQQQIAQLKWEARPAQTPQVVYSGLPPPVIAAAAAAVALAPRYIPQQTNPSLVDPAAVLLASPPLQHALPKNEYKIGKPSSQIASTIMPPSPADVGVADAAAAAVVVTPAARSVAISSQQHQKPPLPMPEHPPLKQQPSSPPLHSINAPAPVRMVLQQSHRSSKNKVPAGVVGLGVGAVPLPGDAQSHFFLSHAQSTGGDQTNAIYLELQQLGFTCWYVPCLCIR